jgi:sulfur relay protein TusB/DsrH
MTTNPLHIVQSIAGLERCLGRATADSSLLLIEDGIYAALAPNGIPAGALYVLAEDLAARNLSPDDLAPGITAIDMKGFVALTVAHSPIATWS